MPDEEKELSVLKWLGYAYYRIGSSQEALATSGRAAQLARALGDKQTLASVLTDIGAEYQQLGDYVHYRTSRSHCRRVDAAEVDRGQRPAQ